MSRKPAALLLLRVSHVDLGSETVHSFESLPVLLGHGVDADLRLQDETVSNYHGQFRLCKGRMQYADLGSRNGSVVSGIKLARSFPVCFEVGDELKIGPLRIRRLSAVPDGVPPDKIGVPAKMRDVSFVRSAESIRVTAVLSKSQLAAMPPIAAVGKDVLSLPPLEAPWQVGEPGLGPEKAPAPVPLNEGTRTVSPRVSPAPRKDTEAYPLVPATPRRRSRVIRSWETVRAEGTVALAALIGVVLGCAVLAAICRLR